MFAEFRRVAKDNAAILVFGTGMLVAELMLKNKDLWRYNLIWEKTTPSGFLNSNRMPLRCHEQIMVFYKHLPNYNPIKSCGHPRKISLAKHKRGRTSNYGSYEMKSYDSTERFPTSILRYKSDKQKESLHPTQKPVELLKYLIELYSAEGETILDNTAGSFSTAMAALSSNRKYIMIEKSPDYFKLGENRVRKWISNWGLFRDNPSFLFKTIKMSER